MKIEMVAPILVTISGAVVGGLVNFLFAKYKSNAKIKKYSRKRKLAVKFLKKIPAFNNGTEKYTDTFSQNDLEDIYKFLSSKKILIKIIFDGETPRFDKGINFTLSLIDIKNLCKDIKHGLYDSYFE